MALSVRGGTRWSTLGVVLLSLPLLVIGIGCGGDGGSSTTGSTTGSTAEATEDARPTTEATPSVAEQGCIDEGWSPARFSAGGLDRKVLWKAPPGEWTAGAVLVLHGGGGKAEDFCTGGALVQPQIAFSELALANGLAVFALDATDDQVTDALGRPCGKRFDFAVTDRANVDLPAVEHVLTTLVPANRPAGSNPNLFLTGLSTGGYMTIRAASHFDALITAFAPISAGDPYGTDPVCDPDRSPREAAVGVLVDRETGSEIVHDDACRADAYPNEHPWDSQNPATKPTFKQFLHRRDGIVDVSCAQKATRTLPHGGLHRCRCGRARRRRPQAAGPPPVAG